MSAMESGYVLGSIAGGAAAGPAGAALGSLVGTLAGAVAAKPLAQHREQTERKQLEAQLGGPQDALTQTAAQVLSAPSGPTAMARVWVDERVERGRVVGGRFEERAIPPLVVAAAPGPIVAAVPRP